MSLATADGVKEKRAALRRGASVELDPIIQFPENSQSLNPYSYIMNNPGTDPTGYQSCLNPEKQGQCRFTATGSRIVKTGEISSDGKGGVQFSGANSLGGKLYTGVGLVSLARGQLHHRRKRRR